MERLISVGIFQPKQVDHIQAKISEILNIMENHPDKENQSDGGNEQ